MKNLSFLSVEEAAERLSCSVSEVKDLLLAGNIPFLAGRPVLIAENALTAYIGSPKKERHSTAHRIEMLEEEYSEINSIFEEVMRQNNDTLRATPLYVKLLGQFKDLPSNVEARRQARIAFLLKDQRQAEPKLRKQKERQASEAAKRRAATLKRNAAVRERQAKKAASKLKTTT